MKAGWQQNSLGNLCDIVGGGTPSKAIKKFWQGDIPWVSPKDMKSEVVDDSIDHISKEAIDGSATSLVPKGSVLIVVRSGILARIVPIAITGCELTINQDLKALRPKVSLEPRFLYHQLDSQMDILLSLVSRGATVHRLMTDQIRSLNFVLPPLSEQKRIVTILDEAFEGLATATANAEKNLSNARELFESQLKAVFTDNSGMWDKHTLADMAQTFGRGKSKHRPRNDPTLYGGKYPFIQTGDIRNSDHFITDYTQTYNEAGLAQSKLWQKGTLCITIAANIAETGILGFDSCFPDSVIGFVADPAKSDAHFVEYLLSSFKARLQAKGKGSAQDNLNLASFENEQFPFPSVTEQKNIASAFDELSAEVTALETIYQQKLAALAELKKSILHQAFTGQLH